MTKRHGGVKERNASKHRAKHIQDIEALEAEFKVRLDGINKAHKRELEALLKTCKDLCLKERCELVSDLNVQCFHYESEVRMMAEWAEAAAARFKRELGSSSLSSSDEVEQDEAPAVEPSVVAGMQRDMRELREWLVHAERLAEREAVHKQEEARLVAELRSELREEMRTRQRQQADSNASCRSAVGSDSGESRMDAVHEADDLRTFSAACSDSGRREAARCHCCGNLLPDAFKFCHICGTQQHAQAERLNQFNPTWSAQAMDVVTQKLNDFAGVGDERNGVRSSSDGVRSSSSSGGRSQATKCFSDGSQAPSCHHSFEDEYTARLRQIAEDHGAYSALAIQRVYRGMKVRDKAKQRSHMDIRAFDPQTHEAATMIQEFVREKIRKARDRKKNDASDVERRTLGANDATKDDEEDAG